MGPLLLYPLYGFIVYLVTMFSLFGLSAYLPHPPPLLSFIANCMSGYLALISCAIYGTLASMFLRLLGLHYKYAQWTTARSFKWACLFALGIKFEISEHDRRLLDGKRPMVLVANHQTELDVLFLACIWPQHTSVTAKKSLRNVPFLGWFMSLSGTVWIDRVNRESALKAFEGAAKTMREVGQNVLIFPEGTRSYSAEPTLLPFKKGGFHLAVQSGADILPVVAENYSSVVNVKAKRLKSGTIRVKGMSLTLF